MIKATIGILLVCAIVLAVNEVRRVLHKSMEEE